MRTREGPAPEEPIFVACWSAKGGCGTTVVAVSLASLLARAGGALVADLAGDVPAVLGMPEPSGPGLADWLAAGESVPADALARLCLLYTSPSPRD